MKPLTPIGSPSPLRLLNKGPDYLRRQMDGGGRGRSISAVERLEADKAKYVKSQQVISTKQEPVLVPCATPPPQPRRPLTVPGASTPRLTPRRPPAAPYSSPGPLVHRCDENENEEDAKKENRQVDVEEEHNRSNAGRVATMTMTVMTTMGTPTTAAAGSGPLVAPHSAPVLRRSTGKRMMRPDSLVIYRQKKECKTPGAGGGGGGGSGGANGELKGYNFVRRLFQGSMREKGSGGGGEGSPKITIGEERVPPGREEDSRMSWTNEKDGVDSGNTGKADRRHNGVFTPERTRNGVQQADWNGNGDCDSDPWKPVVPPVLRRGSGGGGFGGGGLQRSKSDLRLRCSLALSEKERFFDFCGLDLDMVERLGPENFLSGASSVDTLSLVLRSVSGGGGGGGGGGSDASEFSRHSGEGLFQEEVSEQLPSGVSIIERNARVIKWLYSCKNAAQEGPKESTV